MLATKEHYIVVFEYGDAEDVHILSFVRYLTDMGPMYEDLYPHVPYGNA